ncbi:hypothetical protein C5167_031588 [Papaver somniferum]|uniref:Uncharacterized protein n=1 Tax=Papaver somniferum TaxID=3469 RepID=A0A4Y7K8K4_PAPSO|nr:hypothetical protein C5167_031588 [Papaver somniferum]
MNSSKRGGFFRQVFSDAAARSAGPKTKKAKTTKNSSKGSSFPKKAFTLVAHKFFVLCLNFVHSYETLWRCLQSIHQETLLLDGDTAQPLPMNSICSLHNG